MIDTVLNPLQPVLSERSSALEDAEETLATFKAFMKQTYPKASGLYETAKNLWQDIYNLRHKKESQDKIADVFKQQSEIWDRLEEDSDELKKSVDKAYAKVTIADERVKKAQGVYPSVAALGFRTPEQKSVKHVYAKKLKYAFHDAKNEYSLLCSYPDGMVRVQFTAINNAYCRLCMDLSSNLVLLSTLVSSAKFASFVNPRWPALEVKLSMLSIAAVVWKFLMTLIQNCRPSRPLFQESSLKPIACSREPSTYIMRQDLFTVLTNLKAGPRLFRKQPHCARQLMQLFPNWLNQKTLSKELEVSILPLLPWDSPHPTKPLFVVLMPTNTSLLLIWQRMNITCFAAPSLRPSNFKIIPSEICMHL